MAKRLLIISTVAKRLFTKSSIRSQNCRTKLSSVNLFSEGKEREERRRRRRGGEGGRRGEGGERKEEGGWSFGDQRKAKLLPAMWRMKCIVHSWDNRHDKAAQYFLCTGNLASHWQGTRSPYTPHWHTHSCSHYKEPFLVLQRKPDIHRLSHWVSVKEIDRRQYIKQLMHNEKLTVPPCMTQKSEVFNIGSFLVIHE